MFDWLTYRIPMFDSLEIIGKGELTHPTLRVEMVIDRIKLEGGASAAVSSSTQESRGATPRDVAAVDPFSSEVRRRGVVPFLEYARTLYANVKLTKAQRIALYGDIIVPPPVPLFPNETEEEYEREFQMWSVVRKIPAVHTPIQNRSYRSDFAQKRVAWYRGNPPRNPLVDRGSIQHDITDALRVELCEVVYVTLKEYLIWTKCGFFDGLSKLSVTEMLDRFGTLLPPIYAPLQVAETPQQYEDQFRVWLQKTQSLSVEELMQHADQFKQRRYRIKYAELRSNSKGQVVAGVTGPKKKNKRQKEATKVVDPPLKKIKKSEEVEEGEVMEEDGELGAPRPSQRPSATALQPSKSPQRVCQGCDSIDECIACGCKQCLVRGFQQLIAAEISQAPPKEFSVEASVAALVRSRPTTEDLHSKISGKLSCSAKQRMQSAIDPIEKKLVNDYEAINEQVVAHERVLEASASRLALAPVTNNQDANRQLHEKQEKQELIESEIVRRNSALCVLMVYMWRHTPSQLLAMANDANASNALRIQRVAHHKCRHILATMKTKRTLAEELKAQIDSALASEPDDGSGFENTNAVLERLGTLLTTTEDELKQLYAEQRLEFATLIRCDERLRSGINRILQGIHL